MFPPGNHGLLRSFPLPARGGSDPSTIASLKTRPSIFCDAFKFRIFTMVGARSTFPVGNSSLKPGRKSGPAAISVLCRSKRLSVACVPFPLPAIPIGLNHSGNAELIFLRRPFKGHDYIRPFRLLELCSR